MIPALVKASSDQTKGIDFSDVSLYGVLSNTNAGDELEQLAILKTQSGR